MGAFFVTASGTDAGKTYVSALLIRALRARGRRVAAFKPLVSGVDSRNVAASDPAVLLTALGQPLDEAHLAAVAPWRFKAPLSPHMAAKREGVAIDVAELVAFCERAIAVADTDVVLIEGVGGVMVPLDEGRHTVSDWIAALRIPTLLVCGSYLGALSHGLSALAVLRGLDVRVSALIVNESQDSAVSLQETAESFRSFARGIAVVTLERGGCGAEACERILAALGE